MSHDTMSLKFLYFTYDCIFNAPTKMNLQASRKVDFYIIFIGGHALLTLSSW